MKRITLLLAAILLLAGGQAYAQYGQCPAGMCVIGLNGDAPPTCGPCGGGGNGNVPNGSPPQIVGYSSANVAEAETMIGDCTLTRTGTQQYAVKCLSSNGSLFGTAAFANLGTSGGTVPLLSGANTWGSQQTFSLPPIMSGASIAVSTIPTGALATVQGSGTKVQLSTGSTTTNDCVKFDSTGNTVDAGAACGAGGGGTNPIFTHNISEVAGAATMVVQSPALAALDTNYVALNAAATITTPTSSGMSDGEDLTLVATTIGTPFIVTFAPGSGITLKSIVRGDSSPFGTQTACGTVPASGTSWWHFQYSSPNSTLTLRDCGINPPPLNLAANLGGTGNSTLTAHGVMLGEGTSPTSNVAVCGTGSLIYGQASADPICSTTIWPNAATTGDILAATATNLVGRITAVASGQLLTSAGVGAMPVYSPTPILGVAASQSGNITLENGAGGGAGWTLASAATTSWTLTSKSSAPAQGDLFTFSNGTGQMASIPDVATGQVLASQGVNVLPAYTSSPAISGASFVSATIPTAALATVQGNGTKVQLSTGTTTTNDCVKFDVNGNTVDNGSACGGGGGGSNPIFVHTISGTTTTMVVNSSTVAALDSNYLALTGSTTVNTPADAVMADGEQVYLVASTSGSAQTVVFAAGTGTTLTSLVLGDTGTPGSPSACGTIPATGSAWFKWNYQKTITTLVLTACGITPPATSLAANVGGSGLASPTAHSLLQSEAGSPFHLITANTAGNIVIDQGAGFDWAAKPVIGDSTLASSGSMVNLAVHFGATNPVALLNVTPSSGGIPYFSTTTSMGSSGTLTANLPVIGGGAGNPPVSGSVSGNTTTFATTSGVLTSGDCVKIDVNGNLIDNGAACGAGGGGNPIFTHTITGTTPTMVVNSASSATIDTDYLALTGTTTVTTPASSAMADGQELYLVTSTSGTPQTVSFTAGSGTALHTRVVGDSTSTPGTGTACGFIPATGYGWYLWKYSTKPATPTFTLISCGIDAPLTAYTVAQGGTGNTSLTAHGVVLGEGTNSLGVTAAGATGTILYGQSGADPIWSTTTWPNAATTGDLVDATGTNAFGRVTAVAVGQVLTSQGAGVVPAYSPTPTLGTAGSVQGTITLQNGSTGGAGWTISSCALTPWTMCGKSSPPAQGDIFVFTNGTGQMGTVADVATGAVLASGGVNTVPVYTFAPAVSGANLTSGTIPTAALASVRGTGTTVQATTGSFTSGDCVKFDATGNTVDNGSACGGGGGGTPAYVTAASASVIMTMYGGL